MTGENKSAYTRGITLACLTIGVTLLFIVVVAPPVTLALALVLWPVAWALLWEENDT